MDLVFIYFNELEFDEKNIFVLNFNASSNENKIKEIFFLKIKITS